LTLKSYQSITRDLRIALVAPHQLSSNRGNSVTVLRIANEMESLGATVRIWEANRHSDVCAIASEIVDFKPSVINGFHAYHFSRLALRLRQITHVPVVVTATGTDVNVNMYAEATRRITARCLRSSTAVVVFSAATADRLTFEIMLPRKNIRVIPQAVDPALAAEEQAPFERSQDDFVLCLPSALRSIKNPLFCLAPVHSLRTEYPNISVVYAGPPLEPEVLDDLMRETCDIPWAEYLGDLPHNRVSDLIRRSDVVVSASLSEGMSSSLLEAMSLGTPVLASNIEGNKAIIEDGVDGLLFDSETEFIKQMEKLIEDPELRKTLTANARKRIERDHLPEKEAQAYLALYTELAGLG
jgi:glycosyltransferase involved in cell wall biosynthesis